MENPACEVEAETSGERMAVSTSAIAGRRRVTGGASGGDDGHGRRATGRLAGHAHDHCPLEGF